MTRITRYCEEEILYDYFLERSRAGEAENVQILEVIDSVFYPPDRDLFKTAFMESCVALTSALRNIKEQDNDVFHVTVQPDRYDMLRGERFIELHSNGENVAEPAFCGWAMLKELLPESGRHVFTVDAGREQVLLLVRVYTFSREYYHISYNITEAFLCDDCLTPLLKKDVHSSGDKILCGECSR